MDNVFLALLLKPFIVLVFLLGVRSLAIIIHILLPNGKFKRFLFSSPAWLQGKDKQ